MRRDYGSRPPPVVGLVSVFVLVVVLWPLLYLLYLLVRWLAS